MRIDGHYINKTKEVVIMSKNRGSLAGWRSVQRDSVKRLATREHKTNEKLYRANKSGMAPQMARPVIAMMMTVLARLANGTRYRNRILRVLINT